MRRIAIAVLLLCSAAWAGTCGNGYGFYRTITIDHTKVPNTDQSNYPMLFCENGSGNCNRANTFLKVSGSGGDVQSSSGFDIIFCDASSAGNQLSHEIEKYVSTTGEVDFFVKITSVSHTVDTVIYLFYGKSGASDSQAVTSVWSNSFKEVYHLSALSGTPGIKDSTSTANNLTNHSATATTGNMDGAIAFNSASTQYLSGSADNISGNITIELWAHPTSASGFPMEVSNLDTSAHTGYELRVSTNSGGGAEDWIIGGGGGFCDWTDGNHPASINTDQFWFVTATGTTLNMALDNQGVGTLNGTGCSGSMAASTQPLNIGARGGAFTFDGWIDEVRVATVVRSNDWWLTDYASTKSPSTFYTIGTANVVVASGAVRHKSQVF